MPLKRWMYEAAAVLIAAAMIAYMAPRLAGAANMTLPSGQPLFGDFMAFWSAGRATLDGHVEHVHDRAVLWQYQHAIATDARFFAPYNSPPPFLFIACGLALLPYPVAAIGFLLATLVFFLFVARKLLSDARALIFPATAPAVLYHFGTVQAGLLFAGVNGLILHLIDKRPRIAGALIGFMAVKPHLAILWPVFLALSGRWRTFFAAAIATIAFLGAAGLVFGFDAYLRFFESLSNSARLISEQRITTPAYASLFANLLSNNAPQAFAMGAHAVSALAALAMSALVFRRGDLPTAGAALCAATLLISPYLFFYDFLILLVGVALLGAPRNPLETLAAIFAWGAGLTVAMGYVMTLPICPVAAWLVLIAAFRRAGNAAFHSAPALQT